MANIYYWSFLFLYFYGNKYFNNVYLYKVMAELNKLEFKYAQRGIEQSYYRTIANTEMGVHIIDASAHSLITHRKEFKFMRLSDAYISTDTYTQNNYALSIKGAKSLYDYINSQDKVFKDELTKSIEGITGEINERLDMLIDGGQGNKANKVIDTFREMEKFLAGISDSSTLTGLIKDIYDYTDASINRVYQSINTINQNVNKLTLDLQQTEERLDDKIKNISTYIDISINNAFNSITSELGDLSDRLTNLELGGGVGGGGVDADVLKNYVQFKDLETYNIKTSYNIFGQSDKYLLSDVLNLFYEPDIPDAKEAEVIDDGLVVITPKDNTSAQSGTAFSYPVISCKGTIKLNSHEGSQAIITTGTLTAVVTYRLYTAQGIENQTHTIAENLELTVSGGNASFDKTLSFTDAPKLYYGESTDSTSIVSIQVIVKPVQVTYPARTISANNGIIKGTASNAMVALKEPASVSIQSRDFSLGYGSETINYTGYTMGYIKASPTKTNINSFSNTTIFNPAEVSEFNAVGTNYFYFILPETLTYNKLKVIYQMSDNCAESVYEVKKLDVTSLHQNLTSTIARNYNVYGLVNAQGKMVSLYMEDTGKLKIIL